MYRIMCKNCNLFILEAEFQQHVINCKKQIGINNILIF